MGRICHHVAEVIVGSYRQGIGPRSSLPPLSLCARFPTLATSTVVLLVRGPLNGSRHPCKNVYIFHGSKNQWTNKLTSRQDPRTTSKSFSRYQNSSRCDCSSAEVRLDFVRTNCRSDRVGIGLKRSSSESRNFLIGRTILPQGIGDHFFNMAHDIPIACSRRNHI